MEDNKPVETASSSFEAAATNLALAAAQVPKIVSTTSMDKETSPPEFNVPDLSTASALIVQRRDAVSDTPNSQVPASTGTTAAYEEYLARWILFYAGKDNRQVYICPYDIMRLGYGQPLNDQIIEFWLTVIHSERLSEEDRERTFVYDCYFYSHLVKDANRPFKRVMHRTTNVDIFSKDFLIVPINENFRWFLAIICFPGMEGFHDYATLEALPNYKRARLTESKSGSQKLEDPKDEASLIDTPSTDGGESKSQVKAETGESSSSASSAVASSSSSSGTKRKSEFSQAVKHPYILLFNSVACDAYTRNRVYSTLREYLTIEYKTKKNADRVFDRTTMPGIMPYVPQLLNSSDCGLYLLQYVESFFNNPITSYDPDVIDVRNWFPPAIVESKREEIYNFIREKVKEKNPQNECRIPAVSFISVEDDTSSTDSDESVVC